MRALLLILIASCSLATRGAAQCPPLRVSPLYHLVFETSADDLDTTLVFDTGGSRDDTVFVRSVWSESDFRMKVDYDLWGGATLETQDDFTIEGLASGTPVSFTAKLAGEEGVTLQRGYNHFPYLGTSLGAGPMDTDSVEVSQRGLAFDQHYEVSLPLQRAAGQPFRIHVVLDLGTSLDNDVVYANGKLHFDGLPQGASVSSCHGYHQDAAVSAQPMTWGALRARYR